MGTTLVLPSEQQMPKEMEPLGLMRVNFLTSSANDLMQVN